MSFGHGYGIGLWHKIGAVAFSPDDLSGLSAWYKGDAGITITGSGVSDWADQSASGHNLVQTNDSERPINTDTKNGLAVVTFDGVNDDLRITTGSFTAVSQPLTIFCAFQPVDVTNLDVVFDGSSGSTRAALYWSAGGGTFKMNAGSELNTTFNAATNWYVFAGVYDGASSDGRFNADYKVQGGNTNTQDLDGITLGALNNEAFEGNVRIAEYILYSGELALADIQSVENYLNDRWSVY